MGKGYGMRVKNTHSHHEVEFSAQVTETAAGGVKVFLKISQYSQENTSVRISF